MKLETLEACIRDYGRDIYSFCLYLTRSRQEADDLYQDTFLKILEVREQLDFTKNPKSYLLSVAVHIWSNRKRKLAWRQKITGPAISSEEVVTGIPSREKALEDQLITKEEQELVQRAVRKLPEKYRLPIILFYMEGLHLGEIARILEMPQGTVKTRLYRAKGLLQKELEGILDEQKIG